MNQPSEVIGENLPSPAPLIAPLPTRRVGERPDAIASEIDGNRWAGEALVQRVLRALGASGKAGGALHADEIGDSVALPQILRQAGGTDFLTGRDPFEAARPAGATFWWEGVDGSRIFTQVADPENSVARAADAERFSGPVWVGEFAPINEMSTRNAHQRKGDRKSETLLHDAEFFEALTPGSGPAAPRAEALEHAWQLFLSQPPESLSDAPRAGGGEMDTHGYAMIAKLAKGVLEPARARLAGEIDTSSSTQPVIIFNTCSFARDEVISLPDGAPIFVHAPACGYAVADAAAQRPVASFAKPVEAIERKKLIAIDNGMLRLIFDREDGSLRNLRDHRVRREVLEPGRRGNIFEMGLAHAQPVEIHELHSIGVIEHTPLRATIRIERRFGESRLVQKISLTAGSPRIDFDTEVDWQESAQLKVVFPLNIRSPRATYDIPFGHIERPTYGNDREAGATRKRWAQKWADLSEGDYGVALLNDSKLGYFNSSRALCLSLLDSGRVETGCDRGSHQFTYALVPHLGDFRAGAVLPHAYALCHPLAVIVAEPHHGERPVVESFFHVDRPGVVVETVKPAETGNGLIVRLYEAYGTRGSVTLVTSLDVKQALVVNLRGQAGAALEVVEGRVTFSITPFEIVTLRLV